MKPAWALILAVITTPAMAQAQPSFEPVDQAVGDLDPLSVSLRRLGAGLRVDGEHTSLFKIYEETTPSSYSPTPTPWLPRYTVTPHQPVYYRLAPGFQARVDRLNYLRTGRDGEFFELIPANTVFDLNPLPTNPPAYPLPAPMLPDPRIDARIDTRIDARINLQLPLPTPLQP